jgi:hypothetical protein
MDTYSLFGGIRVIEANDHLSFVHLCEVLVQHCSFSVANVQVPAGLGRKACYDLAFLRILETQSEAGSGLCIACFVRLGGYDASESSLGRFKAFQV